MGVFGMRRSLFIIGLILHGFYAFAETPAPRDACFTCHIKNDMQQDENNRLFSDYLADIHVRIGFNCADCHGGDPTVYNARDPKWDKGAHPGKISKLDEIEMCGSCHSDPVFMRNYSVEVSTDQEQEYWTSNHGLALKQGNQKVATCTDCHHVHGIREVDDPKAPVYPLNVPETCGACHGSASYMEGTGLPTDQYEGYVNSVHGRALLEARDVQAPACNDCHGNHSAVPPNVNSIVEICGHCHAQNRDLFAQSKLGPMFEKIHYPGCMSCHGNHAIARADEVFQNWESVAVCKKCHSDGGKDERFVDGFLGIVYALDSSVTAAKTLIREAEIKGMEVSDLYFKVEDAHNAVIHTRTSIHSFDIDFVRETATPGLKSSAEAIEGARASLYEFDYRRSGLLASSLIISVLVLLMYLKLRDIESRKREESD